MSYTFKVLASTFLVAVVGCKSTNFASGNNGEQTPPPAQSQPVAQPVVPNTACTTGTTVARLVTTAPIRNKAAGQTLSFEMSISGCPTDTITADSIMLDFDAEVPNADMRPMTYTVFGPSQALISQGQLIVVSGSDLFGKTSEPGPNGKQYFYNRTQDNKNQSLQIPPNTQRVILNVDLSGFTFHIPGTGNNVPAPGTSEQIKMFLKFGAATPVSQTVTFIN